MLSGLFRKRRAGAGGDRRRRVGGDAVFALAGFGTAGPSARAGRGIDRFDRPLVLVVAALILIGIVMVYSASISLADSPRYNVTPTYFLVRHLFALAVGFAAAVAAFSVPLATWQRLAPWLFLGCLVLLVAVLIPGLGTGALGARRWISLRFFNLQPSELMKIACVLYAADFTVRKQDYMHRFWKGFGPLGFAMLMIAVLVGRQPDLGAALMLMVIGMGILFLGGLSLRLCVAVAIIGIAGLVVVILHGAAFRLERIEAYVDPFAPQHAYAKGYQLTHSLIAFGRGEWFGVGLGGSVEKLHYLTEAHTDFILAVIGEELGLVGVLTVIVLFYWLVKRAFEIGRQAVALERTFAGLVAQGIGLWIGVQAFVNMGVATGLLPTKGLTLPFMSYGGSALVATVVAIALLLRVDWENRVLMRGGRA
jgi:cell division protein FtsW